MSTVFTLGLMLVGAYFGTKYLEGVAEEDPIIIGSTGLGDSLGGTGGGTAAREKRRRRDDDDDDDGKRKLKYTNDVGTRDINGNTWSVLSKEDAKIFYPMRGGEGGLVRVMNKNRVEGFIRRALPSSPKTTSLLDLFNEIHEEVESSKGRGGERGIMPERFGSQWPRSSGDR
jgi:hypothetical protein